MISSLKLNYEVVITDRNGKVIFQERRKAHSYLQAFNEIVLGGMSVAATPCKVITGASVGVDPDGFLCNCNGAIGNASQGIVLGEGDTAVDISDFAMETKIDEGVGAGQLSHLANVIGRPAVVASTCSFTIARTINNGSGGGVEVKEIGIYAKVDNAPLNYACIVRDVLGAPGTVPDGGGITVTYTIKATV